jgi:hypothetical protein
MLPPSSVEEEAKQVLLATCFHVGFLLGLSCDSENGSDMFLQNVN